MKSKSDFWEKRKSKHGTLNLNSTSRFAFKLVLFTLVVLMHHAPLSWFSRTPSAFVLEAQADLVEETFEYIGIKELQVDGMFFAVEVTGYTGDSVEGRIAIPENLYEGNYIEVVHSKSGGVLKVDVEKKRATIPSFTEKALIHIRAPRDVTINLMTSSGSIEIEGFKTKVIRLKSSSGNIKAEDLIGRIDIASSSGSHDIQHCSGPMTVKSSSGRISFRDAAGHISVESSSGSQTFEEIEGNVRAKSSSGRITINKQRGSLDLRATSGRLEGHDVELTNDSSFQTSSGRISFEFENNFDDFSFDLHSSSGVLRVGESRVKGTLILGNGPIKITGKSSSGSQEYR